LCFGGHTLALALRWYLSGHAPWSNGYETLTFVAWATILAGILFSRKTGIAISATAILAALILQTAHLSWMDPQITILPPVLKSYWLIIHVAVITVSYGFLGLAAFTAFVNIVLLALQNKNNIQRTEPQINLLSVVIEMTLIIGLYLMTIGSFLGAVWANESWGRYWSWDPKETWSLITIIVYAIILHLRLIPGLKSRVLFNASALVGFGSVMMTYFGVNYYLTGMHSYAGGESNPVPGFVYIVVSLIVLLITAAALRQLFINKRTK
jgi:cytochrome c-type biogenesis protein CcsB